MSSCELRERSGVEPRGEWAVEQCVEADEQSFLVSCSPLNAVLCRAWRGRQGVTLDQLLKSNSVWSILLVCAFGALAGFAPETGRILLLTLAIGYGGVALLALKKRPWAVGVSIIVAIGACLRWAPVVVLNTWLFVSGDARYRDSPGTIIIVGVYALLFAIPATFLVIGYALRRSDIVVLIRSRNNELPA